MYFYSVWHHVLASMPSYSALHCICQIQRLGICNRQISCHKIVIPTVSAQRRRCGVVLVKKGADKLKVIFNCQIKLKKKRYIVIESHKRLSSIYHFCANAVQVIRRSKIIFFGFPQKTQEESLSSPRCLKSRPSTEKTEAWAKKSEEVERNKWVKAPAEEEEVYVEKRLGRVWVYFYLSASIAPLSN